LSLLIPAWSGEQGVWAVARMEIWMAHAEGRVQFLLVPDWFDSSLVEQKGFLRVKALSVAA
jgi:hypothetical protein